MDSKVKILKYAPRVSWLCGWAKLPGRRYWIVSHNGVQFGEVFQLTKNGQYYGLVYDRSFTEFPSGCIESTNFTEVVDAVSGIGVNRET